MDTPRRETAAMTEEPDNTAVRTALWRALHLEVDAPPHVFEDDLALQLADPEDGWRQRPDMDPEGTRGFRASIVGRARFVADLVHMRQPNQFVILGAGLDTFALRAKGNIQVYEIDQPGTQAWKRRRIAQLGWEVPGTLTFVPVDFEAGQPWWDQLAAAGFDPRQPAVVASTGVSMYLTKDTTRTTLRRIAALAPGTTYAMTFLLEPSLVADADRAGLRMSSQGAKASGTPFVSFYTPAEILDMAREAGFGKVQHMSGTELAERYFAGRADGLRPSTGEDFLVATV